MTTLEKKLRASLRRLGIESGAGTIAAVSGGADSTAMLDALARILKSEELLAAHLNHQLRGEESDADERFVAALAARLNLDCVIERIPVAAQARARKENLEAAARRLRYDFLRRVAESRKRAFVFTAHTQDDQAETILMRLLRGTGPEGLRGIHQVRQLAENVRLVRPLLETTREEVIAHCRHYELEFRHDSSNDVTSLTRNRVRHELLPLLRTFNPRFNESISRTAELATDEQNYLKRLSSAVYAEIHRAGEIEIEPLRQCHPALRRRILRLWLRDQRGGLQRIEMAHLLALENLIVSQSGHRVVLPYGWTARREFDRIILRKSGEILTNSFDLINLAPISLVHDCEVNFGRFRLFIQRNISCRNISCRNISRHRSGQPADSGRYFAYLRECDELDGLLVRTRIPGDAYLPSGGSHKIKLKTLMIKKRIPLSEREYYPLLVTSKGEIVWAPGLPVASRFSVGPGDSETMKCALVTAEKLGGRDVTNETPI